MFKEVILYLNKYDIVLKWQSHILKIRIISLITKFSNLYEFGNSHFMLCKIILGAKMFNVILLLTNMYIYNKHNFNLDVIK